MNLSAPPARPEAADANGLRPLMLRRAGDAALAADMRPLLSGACSDLYAAERRLMSAATKAGDGGEHRLRDWCGMARLDDGLRKLSAEARNARADAGERGRGLAARPLAYADHVGLHEVAAALLWRAEEAFEIAQAVQPAAPELARRVRNAAGRLAAAREGVLAALALRESRYLRVGPASDASAAAR